jgi:hypothetical protein
LRKSEVANAKAHAYLLGIAYPLSSLCVLSRNNLLTKGESSWNVSCENYLPDNLRDKMEADKNVKKNI